MKFVSVLLIFLFFTNVFAESAAKDNPRRLHSFSSIEDFEDYLGRKKIDCLDHSGGGSRAANCFDEYEAWDYELNYYYKRLRKILDAEEKTLLKNAQLAWIEYRNTSIDLNSALLDRKYADKEGTMYIAMRAADASRAIDPIIKDRTIFFILWHDRLIKED